MNERLQKEFAGVLETLDHSDVAWLRAAGGDGLMIVVEFDVRSLYRGAQGVVEERAGVVGVRYQLHPDHPQVPPIPVADTPQLFNVHINDPELGAPNLPPIPLICLGPFLPQTRLSDWVVATYDLLRWARISTERPLNVAAAQFARRESAKPGRFPVDPRSFWRDGAESVADETVAPPAPNEGEPSPAAAAGLRLGDGWRTT